MTAPLTQPMPRRVTIDLEHRTLCSESWNGACVELDFDDPRAFAAASDAWLQVGWDAKYVYSFTWMGRPMIQLPEDMMRVQEVVHALRPDVIIETGIAHGGSIVFYASLMEAMGHGHVIGVDVEIREHNRRAMEAHPLRHRFTLIEGSSVAPEVVDEVRRLIPTGAIVLVLLDSNHTKAHVRAELDAYSPFVSAGSWIVAADGIMKRLRGAPRSLPEWETDNPADAAADFLAAHPEFEFDVPAFSFNEGVVNDPVTYWNGGWLRRKS